MLTLEKLHEYGANTKEALERCMGSEAFYIRLIGMAINDANFEKLPRAIELGDLNAAFEAAHALKGVLSNLALTPMLDPVLEITELLRSRTQADYAPYVEEILTQREKLLALME